MLSNNDTCSRNDVSIFNRLYILQTYPLITYIEQMANVNTRYVWTEKEIKLFLALIQENNLTAILDGKQQRISTIYQDPREMMLLKGYKPWNVLRSKWKALKQRYIFSTSTIYYRHLLAFFFCLQRHLQAELG